VGYVGFRMEGAGGPFVEGVLRGFRGSGLGTASEPSTWANNLAVPQLVFYARGAFPRS